jgi:hypothetical protein
MSAGSNIVPGPAILAEVFCNTPQCLQENTKIIITLDHDRVLPGPFHYIIRQHSSIRHRRV